ncbi:hypothetical protein PUN28_011259 [Cardiocondyla obscurior]|uniref:Uncharacterized protein n=1 Tax=Cardiocondyla obscurior TaxID=286306 RepID=A0AAW2FMQ5_9HYME
MNLNSYEELNPCAVSFGKNDSAVHSECSINVDNADNLSKNLQNDFENSNDKIFPEKNRTDCLNDENLTTDHNNSQQLNIIDEDTDRLSFVSPCENKKKIDEQNETSLEMINDSLDDTEATISVSLPLKFKFSRFNERRRN